MESNQFVPLAREAGGDVPIAPQLEPETGVDPATGPLLDYSEGDPGGDLGQPPMIPLPDYGEGGPTANQTPTHAYIRFLNAIIDDGDPLRITLGSQLMTTHLTPGNLTAYAAVPTGFRTLVFFDARFPWVILYRLHCRFSPEKKLPWQWFAPGRSGLVRVDDRPCGSTMDRAWPADGQPGL